MAIIVLLVWTLLALGDARIYERCELARTLLSLGVDKDLIGTWVCIAYHESRFDTAARNLHSGDHGLLQISEIYWCGPGKVCGIPCSALRDEDISDDIQCAHQIYKEHTRLQGDGFKAWVVYPLYCKHNANKYLADCEESLKHFSENVSLDEQQRSLSGGRRNVSIVRTNYLDIDKLKPPYLAINSIIETNSANNKKGRLYWQNYKIDNIDSLQLPVFKNNDIVQYISPPTTTQKHTTTAVYKFIASTTNKPSTTTLDPYLIGINPPMPRRIESDQFRLKIKGSTKNQIIIKDSNNWFDLSTTTKNNYVTTKSKIYLHSQESSTTTLNELTNKSDNIEQNRISLSTYAYSLPKISIPDTNDNQEITKTRNEDAIIPESIKYVPAISFNQQKIIEPVTTISSQYNTNNNYYAPFYNRNSLNSQSNGPLSINKLEVETTAIASPPFNAEVQNTAPKNQPSYVLSETKSRGVNGFPFSYKNLTEYTPRSTTSNVSYKNIYSSDGFRSQTSSSSIKAWPYTTSTTTSPKPTTANVSTRGSSWSSRNILTASNLPISTETSTRTWQFSNKHFNNPVSIQTPTTSQKLLSPVTTTPSPWSRGFSRQTQKNTMSINTTSSPSYLYLSSKNTVSVLDLQKTTPRSWTWGLSREFQSNSLLTTAPPNHYSITATKSPPNLNGSSRKITSELNSPKTIKTDSWPSGVRVHNNPVSVTTTPLLKYPFLKSATYSSRDKNGFKNITSATDSTKTSTRSWRNLRPFSNSPMDTTTSKPLSTTTTIYRWTTKSTPTSDTSKITQALRLPETSTTQKPSIFDLYLRPQKGSPYAPIQFAHLNNTRRIQIFAKGTTAAPNSHW